MNDSFMPVISVFENGMDRAPSGRALLIVTVRVRPSSPSPTRIRSLKAAVATRPGDQVMTPPLSSAPGRPHASFAAVIWLTVNSALTSTPTMNTAPVTGPTAFWKSGL